MIDGRCIARWSAQQEWSTRQTVAVLHQLGHQITEAEVAHEMQLARGGAGAALPASLIRQLTDTLEKLGIPTAKV
jgi:hypothetical protein